MDKITFDFHNIHTEKEFYKAVMDKMQLSDCFGNNLDALWDVINGDIALPVEVAFINLSMSQLDAFTKIIDLFTEAHETLGEEFVFNYSLRAN